MKRLLAIGLIWLGCAVAWLILGSTILVRTGDTSSSLTTDVHLLWGPPMHQHPPRAFYKEQRKVEETVTSYDAHQRAIQTEVERTVEVEQDISLTESNIDVDLKLEHRRKGLVWFPTYGIGFEGNYEFTNDTDVAREVELRFPLASENALYDGFMVVGEDGGIVEALIQDGLARWTQRLEPGQKARYAVRYRSRGTSQWYYHLAAGTGQVRRFRLDCTTDFAKVDFPPGSLSPSTHDGSDPGWKGQWSFDSLVANAPIGIELPQRLNPGPLASRITFFAPVGLLFFFFVVAVFAAARRKLMHPLNYFFFGCAFFAFHLLFAYLVDHLPVFPSFALASLVSVALVVTYARWFVGWRFALLHMGLSQLMYLVMFSFTFFWDGFTGLSITAGAIVTLFVMMQLTGKVKWTDEPERQPAQAATGA